MAYTVKELAKLSGVSVRTLHYYDEIDLLKPAYYGENGYRLYEEKELLILQQILFFKELGFELKKIKQVLNRSDFDKQIALSSHRKLLEKKLIRTKAMIDTIDKTINHLRGERKMEHHEMYWGIDSKKQKKYEQELIERFGEKAKRAIEECQHKTKSWSKADWEKARKEGHEICKKICDLMKASYAEDSTEVQKLIYEHFKWLNNFWSPEKVSYISYGERMKEKDFEKYYSQFDPHFADFLAKAIKIFSENEL